MLTRQNCELKSGIDKNLNLIKMNYKNRNLKLTSNIQDLKSINCFIVTVRHLLMV